MRADATFVAPVKLQEGPPPSNGNQLGRLPEEIVIARVGHAIAEAATERRKSVGEDVGHAARRAAVSIATAMLGASSTETASHSDDVDVISEGIARKLGLSGPALEDVIIAARLHDIGKIGIPREIIEKPAALDTAEWEAIRRHTLIGEQILLAVPELRGAAYLVRHSHERWDGDGYADRLAGDEIPLASRIIFCADAYHAILSDRPYRAGRSRAEALAEIRACAGTQFDPSVVEALEALAAEMRASNNGRRPRTARAQRLMALLLVMSIGTAGSAFARSGLMPEAKRTGSAPIAGAAAAGAGAAAIDGRVRPAGPLGGPGDQSAAARGALPASGGFGLLTVQVPGLVLPPGLAGIPGVIELPGATGGPGDEAGSAPDGSKPGVRDHGQGRGRGKGQGKGRGAQLGRDHAKSKQDGKASGSGSHAGSKQKGRGASKSHGSGPAHSSSTESGKPETTGSPGGSRAGSGSTQAGSADKTAAPTKQPKAPNPPPAPKILAPPATGGSTNAPPAPGAGTAGSGTGSPSGGNAGGPGTGRG